MNLGEETEVKRIKCKTHGVSDEVMVIRCQGKIVGVFCCRCWADFLIKNIGEATPIFTE